MTRTPAPPVRNYFSNREARRHRWTAWEVARLRVGCRLGESWPGMAEAIGLPIACLVYRSRLLGIRGPRGAQRRCQEAAE